MLKPLKALTSLWGTKKSTSEKGRSAIVYPPKPSSYPAISESDVWESNADIIHDIYANFSGSQKEWDELCLPLIRAYLNYVHLLPASQRHHHRHKGGLARHGLEVAYKALRIFETRLYALRVNPAQRKRTQASWRMAIFTAALLHDVGKPAADMVVTNDKGEAWDGFSEPLTTWLTQKRAKFYDITWRKDNRHKRHEATGVGIAMMITPVEVRRFISEAPVEDVMTPFMLSLQCNSGSEIYEAVVKADKKSVEIDIKENGAATETGEAEPLGLAIKSAMRWLYQKGAWKLNKPGGVLWSIEGNVLLVWPEAARSIVKQMMEERAVGIPTNPDVLADVLVQTGLAREFGIGDTGPGDTGPAHPIWLFKPCSIKGDKPLTGLCLVEGVLSHDELPSIEGMIVSDPAQPKAAVNEEPCPPNMEQEAEATAPVNEDPPVQPESDEIEGSPGQEAQPVRKSKSDNQNSKKPNLQGNTTKKAENKIETVQNPKDTSDVGGKEDKQEGKAQSAKDVAAIISQDNKKITDRLGHLGGMLMALADDIRLGKLQWGEHITVHKGCLGIAYPHGVDGYGVDPNVVMSRLEKNRLLIKDPISPKKKVLSIPGLGGAAGIGNGLLLDKGLTDELLAFAGVKAEDIEQENAKSDLPAQQLSSVRPLRPSPVRKPKRKRKKKAQTTHDPDKPKESVDEDQASAPKEADRPVAETSEKTGKNAVFQEILAELKDEDVVVEEDTIWVKRSALRKLWNKKKDKNVMALIRSHINNKSIDGVPYIGVKQ